MALSNVELKTKFDSIINEFLTNKKVSHVTHEIKNQKCDFYMHEFVKRFITKGIEAQNPVKLLFFN